MDNFTRQKRYVERLEDKWEHLASDKETFKRAILDVEFKMIDVENELEKARDILNAMNRERYGTASKHGVILREHRRWVR